MTDEQDTTSVGWDLSQLLDELNMKKSGRKKERRASLGERYFARWKSEVRSRKLTRDPKPKYTKGTSTTSIESNDTLSLSWLNGYPVIPVEAENALIPILLPQGKTERGNIYNQPPARIKKIIRACETNGMHLEQALSLRTYHIVRLNPQFKSMSNLGLGKSKDARGAANRFQTDVLEHLKRNDIPFRTKEEEKIRFLEKSETDEDDSIMPPTPDFVLTSPVLLTTFQPVHEGSTFKEHGQINWIDAKRIYGASIDPGGLRSNTDGILSTAKKYISIYGPGAFAFSYGCGSELRKQLIDLDVQVLDSCPVMRM